MTKPFFAGSQLSDWLAEQKKGMIRDIDKLDGDNLLSFSPETLAEGIAHRYGVTPININEDLKRVDVHETRVDARMLPNRAVLDRSRPVWVDGTSVTLSVPFKGTQELLALQSATWDGSFPQGSIVGSELVFEQSWPDTPTKTEVETWVDHQVGELRKHIGWQDPEIRAYDESLEGTALQAISRRRDSLLAKRNLQASLPFGMTVRAGAPLTFAPEGVRRKPAWTPPQAKTSGKPFEPEASLSTEQFEDILRTMRAIGHSMERTPAAFAKLDEEELRSVFLAALNAQFEGGASGETFNAAGKTDILIRFKDKNLFVGECKIWEGPAALSDAIDQVLGYVCWRDSHAAIVLFVRNKDMSSVIGKSLLLSRRTPIAFGRSNSPWKRNGITGSGRRMIPPGS